MEFCIQQIAQDWSGGEVSGVQSFHCSWSLHLAPAFCSFHSIHTKCCFTNVLQSMSSLHVSDRGWDSYGSRRAMWHIFGLLKVLPFNTQNHTQPCRLSLVTLPIQGDLFGTTGPDDFNQFCYWFQWSQNSALSLQLAVSTGDFHCLKLFKTKHIVPWKKLCPSVAFCCKTRIIPGNCFKGRDIPSLLDLTRLFLV